MIPDRPAWQLPACLQCEAPLSGRQRKFCSARCRGRWHHHRLPVQICTPEPVVVCADCRQTCDHCGALVHPAPATEPVPQGLNTRASTRHYDMVEAWRSLPDVERQGGLTGFVRWVGTVLPASRVASVLCLDVGFVSLCLSSTVAPPSTKRPS